MKKMFLEKNIQSALIYFSGVFGFLATIVMCGGIICLVENGEANKKEMFITIGINVVSAIILLFISIIDSCTVVNSIVPKVFDWIFKIVLFTLGFFALFSTKKDETKNKEELDSKEQ